MNLFLIGYRGSGKTTVASALSDSLGWPWLDADAELERRAGKTIKQMFADDGEGYFRDEESAVLRDVVSADGQILALGGGVVLREENRKVIAARGKVVWLQASPAVLFDRIREDPTTAERRPNLTGTGGLDEIRTLLAQRTPIYQQCADLAIDVENKLPAEIARQIIDELGLMPQGAKDSE